MSKTLRFAVLMLCLWAGTVNAAELAHRWSFNGDLTDSVGGQDAVIVNQGGDAVLDSTQVTLGGGSKGSADYIDLPDGIVNSLGDNVTFEIWATQDAIQNWSRIFDFGSDTSNNLFMSWTNGTTLTQDRVEWHDASGNSNVTSDSTNAPYQLGVEYHIAMVVDGDNDTVTWYSAPADNAQLGPAKGSFTCTYNLSQLSYTNCWLGQSQYGDNTASASFDEFRIWKGVLSAAELQQYQVFGPDLINPGRVSQGTPADGETDVALDQVLQWSQAYYAQTYNLYVGTDFNDVNDATVANPLGTMVAVPGLTSTSYTFPNDLQLDQHYYWRVDAVNAPPSNYIFKGSVWSFNAEPTVMQAVPIAATASSQMDATSGPEKTIDGSGLNANDEQSTDTATMWSSNGNDPNGTWIQYEFAMPKKLSKMLVWNYNMAFENILGGGVKDANIELSMDGTTWTPFGSYVFADGTGKAGYAANTTIDFNGTWAKYVKINALDNWGNGALVKQIGLSEVRFLVIPAAARRPDPASGATLKSIDDTLVWRAGRGAESHQLYIDSNEALVAAGDSNALVTSPTERHYSLSNDSSLLYGEKYYWKVKEVSPEGVIDGPVWDFNTPDHFVVDDMESYTDDEGTRIFDVWQDGYGNDNNNGSVVGYDTAPFAEQTTVYAGKQSMPFNYDNTHGETDAWADLAIGGQDWTRGGLKQLSLFFLGDRGNNGGQLYIEIDGKRVTNSSALNLGLWKQWIVDLSSVGANLKNVQTLTVGVTGANAKGLVYIDEICLYREAPQIAAATPQDPGTNGLEVQYSMENNLNDSSGHNRDGDSGGGGIFVPGLSAGVLDLGTALSFNGTDDVVTTPLGNLVSTLSDSTYSAWVNLDGTDTAASWMRVFDFGDDTSTYMFLSPRSGTNGPPRFGIIDPNSPSGLEQPVQSAAALTPGWHHLAVVITSGDPNGTLTLYVDGIPTGPVATDTMPKDLGVTTNNWLGESQWSADSYFGGTMDEFRIYSRALSAGEIRYLAGDR